MQDYDVVVLYEQYFVCKMFSLIKNDNVQNLDIKKRMQKNPIKKTILNICNERHKRKTNMFFFM